MGKSGWEFPGLQMSLVTCLSPSTPRQPILPDLFHSYSNVPCPSILSFVLAARRCALMALHRGLQIQGGQVSLHNNLSQWHYGIWVQRQEVTKESLWQATTQGVICLLLGTLETVDGLLREEAWNFKFCLKTRHPFRRKGVCRSWKSQLLPDQPMVMAQKHQNGPNVPKCWRSQP